MPKLRRFELHSLDEVIAEITRLREGGYARGGNWNLTQVCEHLEGTIRIERDGTMKPLPWVVRATVGNLIFWLLASRVIHGVSGVRTLASLVPEPRDPTHDDNAAIDRCLALHREARDIVELPHTYPLATGVSADRWKTMMTVHAQHHLEFLKPESA
ncbi:MAG: DUF1569 domain-containing protein [Planctomycetota bacterium]